MQEALREGLALAQKVSKPPPPHGVPGPAGVGGGSADLQQPHPGEALTSLVSVPPTTNITPGSPSRSCCWGWTLPLGQQEI